MELVAFDLLWLDGQDLTGRPLSERRGDIRPLLIHFLAEAEKTLRKRTRGLTSRNMARKRTWRNRTACVEPEPSSPQAPR